MASFSEFQLHWCDVNLEDACGSRVRREDSTKGNEDTAKGSEAFNILDATSECRQLYPCEAPFEQFVFASQNDLPLTLQRIQSVHDLLHALSGEQHSAEKFMVSLLAVFVGHWIATGQIVLLTVFAIAGLLTAILDLRCVGALIFASMSVMLASNLWKGVLSIQWLLTVAIVMLVLILILTVIVNLVRQDPRSYVLLMLQHASATTEIGACRQDTGTVAIRNDCFMDVKLLIFDANDVVRWVPQGGLLGGLLLRRGALHVVGQRPPCIVKFYAPWEKELGTFYVDSGKYSFKPTFPPVLLLPSKSPTFTNCTEAAVQICICDEASWIGSLWMPFAPLFARLLSTATRVPPGSEVTIHGPCLVRIFEGLMEHSCCVVKGSESVQYHGVVRWTPVNKRTVRSSSTTFVPARH